eukprot:Gb_27202 [translate_table: standard]
MSLKMTSNNATRGREIDPSFVQSKEHRPKHSYTYYDSSAGDRIPIIDLSLLQSCADQKSLEALVFQVGKACREWGFFMVLNHGVPLDLPRRVKSAASVFYSLPLDEKRKIRRDDHNPLGYFDNELTENVRDWREVFTFVIRDAVQLPLHGEADNNEIQTLKNQWPQNPPDLREACESYAQAVEKLSFRLLELISQSLGLPTKRLNDYFSESSSFIRLNNYPACPAPQMALGVGRHKDGGGLTVLWQDEEVGGLEVRRKDGQWVGVEPVTGSFVINVGDCMQVWSNDEYESVEHRAVVNEERQRFSIPFFFNPSHSVMVKPLAELVSVENPPKYREFNWGKFYKKRKDSNYKDLGVENLQIHHFKTSAVSAETLQC